MLENFISLIRENIVLFDILFLIFVIYFSIQCLAKGFFLSLMSFLKWILALILTIILGAIFTAVQAYEYQHATFAFTDGIYASTFYMATGFHGFHVLVGTIFLTVCLFRGLKGHFSADHHFGFEAAAWYWHFVDVVWLFLFICIYMWGS